jgi:hypothetical protein
MAGATGFWERAGRRCALAAAAVLLFASGCKWGETVTWIPGLREPPRIPEESNVEQIVQVLNISTLGTATQEGLRSWSSTNATVSVPGMAGMVNVPATIAVEAPRNLRIRISHPFSRTVQLDLGSNPDEFWVWARDSDPKGVVHVQHEDVELISRYFNLPIHPDWMMEVFGVVPLDARDYRKEASEEGPDFVELIGHKTAPNGMRVANVVRVDMTRGVIVRRALHADDGTVLGVAEYAKHERDSRSELMLPREITLKVPAMGSEVTFYLKNVQLNPPPLQAQIWQPPRIAGEPDVQLVDRIPLEARAASPLLLAGEEEPARATIGEVTHPRHSSGGNVEGTAHVGDALRSYAWTDPGDDLSAGGVPDSDPTARWSDIGSVDLGDPGPTASSLEADPGDAPRWEQIEFEPTPVPSEDFPAEEAREFEPAGGVRPEWAHEPESPASDFEFDDTNMR